MKQLGKRHDRRRGPLDPRIMVPRPSLGSLAQLVTHFRNRILKGTATPPRHLTLGRESYGSPTVHVHVGDTARVRIGSFVSIAADVEIFVGGNHRTDWVSTFPFRLRFGLPGAGTDGHPATKGDVIIGNDVWIARGAKILSGVKIGDGAVIGAYALVSKDVRPYAIVAGNPAREIRRRFSDEQVDALQSIAWWDWPLDKIHESVSLLSSSDVDAFIREATTTPSSTQASQAQASW